MKIISCSNTSLKFNKLKILAKQCSTCDNTIGSYDCNCPDGWHHSTGNQAAEGCIHDVDECTDATICNNAGDGSGSPTAGRIFATCYNNVGSYDCDCIKGYYLTHDKGSQAFMNMVHIIMYICIMGLEMSSQENSKVGYYKKMCIPDFEHIKIFAQYFL